MKFINSYALFSASLQNAAMNYPSFYDRFTLFYVRRLLFKIWLSTCSCAVITVGSAFTIGRWSKVRGFNLCGDVIVDHSSLEYRFCTICKIYPYSRRMNNTTRQKIVATKMSYLSTSQFKGRHGHLQQWFYQLTKIAEISILLSRKKPVATTVTSGNSLLIMQSRFRFLYGIIRFRANVRRRKRVTQKRSNLQLGLTNNACSVVFWAKRKCRARNEMVARMFCLEHMATNFNLKNAIARTENQRYSPYHNWENEKFRKCLYIPIGQDGSP